MTEPSGIVNGHKFCNFKSEEMICWQCGYVIWRCQTNDEIEDAILQLADNPVFLNECPGTWHGWDKYNK